MKIRDTVFGSQSECGIYEALKWQWKDYDIYPNLPFLNIIETGEADIKARTLNQREWDFLLKTSVDFTLCERPTHRPLLSIEFDGLGHGFSHFPPSFQPPDYVQTLPAKDPYRKLKLDLKLRLCYQIIYPYFVVSYEEAYPFEEDLGFSILDGIIGWILSRKRFEELLYTRKTDLEEEPYENYEKMKKLYECASGKEYTYNDYIQDWAAGLEVEAELESDPICREIAIIKGKLWEQGILKGRGWTVLEEPPAPALKESSDAETIENQAKELQSPFTKIGCEVSFETNTSLGEVKAKVLCRNIERGMSLVISHNIAELLALRKIASKLNLS